MRHGLEVGCLAAIDLKSQTALSLEAIQTPSNRDKKKKINLITHFTQIFRDRATQLLTISKYVVVDGYFMKKKFILPLLDMGFHTITKMRQDARLHYLYKGKTKTGRPRKYTGRMNLSAIDKKYMRLFADKNGIQYYSGKLFCRALGRIVQIVYSQNSKTKEYEILLSTDLQLEADKIVYYYTQRFQIEFLIRDAKQNAGLEDCQARSLKKYAFHFNMSFSSVSLAKVAFHIEPTNQSRPFSMQNIKRLYYNYLLIEQLLSYSGLDLKFMKTKKGIQECLNFGQIAA